MKNTNKSLQSLALAVLLAATPMLSHAKSNTETKTDSASTTFSFATLSDVAVSYSWSDLVYKQARNFTTVDGALTYTLSLANSSGKFSQVSAGTLASDGVSGSASTSFSDLAAGSYRMVITGSWVVPSSGVSFTAKGTIAQDVSLGKATIMASVPEPESYAMLMAGLGLMGFIARRRRVR